MDGTSAATARTSDAAGATVAKFLGDARATLDGTGLHVYHASYVDLVLGAESEQGAVTLVAGSHSRCFPYFDTQPWDSCLLQVGATGYTYTSRAQGLSLRFEIDLGHDAPRGVLLFRGEMRRVSDGEAVALEIAIPLAMVKLPTRLLGESYNFLELDDLLGLRWTPYALAGERSAIRIAGKDLAIENIHGACERGVLSNLKALDFAIRYEYVSLACPGHDGYGFVQFTAHALIDSVLGKALDRYLRRSASALLTIEGDRLTDGNPRGVYSPPPDDAAVAVFEAEIDLGPAVVKRQMIETRDRAGRALHGLREIFIPKPQRPRQRRVHLNGAQVNALLIALVIVDVMLATVALASPARWTELFHGQTYPDPAGLLRRAGAVWAALVVVQAIARVRWQDQPHWLAIVAGARLTELCSGWIVVGFAEQMTVPGKIGLLLAPPVNLLVAVILVATYRRQKACALPPGPLLARPWSWDA